MSDPASSARGPDEPPSSLGERLRDWLKALRGRSTDESLRESLEELLEEHAASSTPANSDERTLLRNVLGVGKLRVDDVMVPRADVVGVEEKESLDVVIRIFDKAQHSRLPVYRETLDDVIGMVHVKDLLPYWNSRDKKFALANVTRKLLFVPPSMPVMDLLLQMRATRIHMALVVDEYGGIDGLVTIEDLVEQIVGEIDDEHDEEEGPMLVDRPDGTLEANGRAEISDLEARVGASLLDQEQEEDIDTLGGLVFSLVGRIPQRGELIAHPSGLEFEVLEADPRRVKRLRVRNLEAVRQPTNL